MNAVAVVIPCRDLGRYVEAAITSVRMQTREAAEIVVVDDGSTDAATRAVLDRLGATGTRVVRTTAGSPAGARNAGIRATTAPFVVTLDADDLLEPDYVRTAAERLDAEPSLTFVTTSVRAFGDAAWVWTPPSLDAATFLTTGAPHCASMFRRDVWHAIGGFDEDPALGGLDDLDFWISAVARGHRGTVVPEALFCFRVRRDSMHHEAVERGTHGLAMAAVLTKHRTLIERLGPAVLLAKERAIVALKQHQRDLDARRRVRHLNLGDLRRLTPISDVWGTDRGRPIDRHYIEAFLERYRADVRGSVLEVKDPMYTRRFGGAAVTASDVLDVDAANQRATIVADLAKADAIPSDRFDCFILTQTLHIIYDVKTALAHAHRILKPGGTLLCTLPAVSRVNYEDGGLEAGDYWRFTEAAARRMFAEVFAPGPVEITAHGNVLVNAAFLYGLAADELTADELAHTDRWFPLLFCVRAVKARP